jgi:tripartite-type tricarboxylate transporter receptor subunit TctC
MKTMLSRLLVAGLTLTGVALAALATGTTEAAAQGAYPTRPVKIVVPFPAGGPNDFIGRVLTNKLTSLLGQPVVVENKAGAAGMTGAEAVANAAPDGYTLILPSAGAMAILPSIMEGTNFDPFRDLTPITLVALAPEVLAVTPKLGVHNLKELVAYCKEHPGKVNFASTGSGSTTHLAGEMFKKEAKIDVVHIPYRGAAPAVNDLLGGHVDFMFADIPVLRPHIEAGTLIGVAFASAKRTAVLPNIPTTAEEGLPGVLGDNWYALFAPAKTPPEIIKKLNETVVAALKAPDVADALNKQGAIPSPGTPEELSKFHHAEAVKWGGLAKQIGVKLD